MGVGHQVKQCPGVHNKRYVQQYSTTPNEKRTNAHLHQLQTQIIKHNTKCKIILNGGRGGVRIILI